MNLPCQSTLVSADGVEILMANCVCAMCKRIMDCTGETVCVLCEVILENEQQRAEHDMTLQKRSNTRQSKP